MDGSKRGSSTVASLPPPTPNSPPDLFGKRREVAMLQMLHTEVAFLQEELKSVGRIQTASLSCKEVADFVIANSDPLVTVSHKVHRPHWIWRWLCGNYTCFNQSRICCCFGCFPHYKQSDFSTPKSQSCPNSCWPCCRKGNCCDCESPSYPDCSCSCSCSCSKCTCCWRPICPKVPRCSCIKSCCYSFVHACSVSG